MPVSMTTEGETRMRFKSLILCALFAVVPAFSAQAAGSSPTMLDGNSTSDILNLMRGYGSATLGTQDSGDPKISGKIDGQAYTMYFSNCSDGKDCEDIDLYAGYLDVKPAQDLINSWNRDKRFSRAYLDKDGDAGLDMDINLIHGVSQDNLDSTLSVWAQLVKKFTAYIGAK